MKFMSDIARVGRKFGVKPVSNPIPVLEQKAKLIKEARFVLGAGKIPLLVGRSGTGKTVIGRELLNLPQNDTQPMLNLRHDLGRLLRPDDYFKPEVNSTLFIDELSDCEIGEAFFNMLSVAISHEMHVVITAQALRDLNVDIINDERVVAFYL